MHLMSRGWMRVYQSLMLGNKFHSTYTPEVKDIFMCVCVCNPTIITGEMMD